MNTKQREPVLRSTINNRPFTAADLDITPEEYERLVVESLSLPEWTTGYVATSSGFNVWASS